MKICYYQPRGINMSKISKSEKVKITRIRIISTVACVILVALVVGLAAFSASITQKQPEPSTHSYEQNTYTPIDGVTFENMLNNGSTFFIYIGRPTCPHCAKFAPLLSEVLAENRELRAYHYDTDEAKVENREKFNELMTRLDITGVPVFFKIQNGFIVDELDDYTSKNAIRDFLAS